MTQRYLQESELEPYLTDAEEDEDPSRRRYQRAGRVVVAFGVLATVFILAAGRSHVVAATIVASAGFVIASALVVVFTER